MILTLDAHAKNVWRSDDDGKSWKKVNGVPDGDAWDITEHPFDKKRAFIFGEGKEHWYTEDRGVKWHKFKSEVPLSLIQLPLAFHAEEPEWILYSGRICEDEDDIFGISCKEVVSCCYKTLCPKKSSSVDTHRVVDLLHKRWVRHRNEEA